MATIYLRTLVGLAGLALTLTLTACGGGSGDPSEPAPAPAELREGIATLGTQGGRVLALDGAELQVPAGALPIATTLALARDGTQAPTFPVGFRPAGSIWSVTPHGTRFGDDVTVRVPYDAGAVGSDDRVALLKGELGGGWRLIDDAVVQDGIVTARVRDFSFLQPVLLPRARTWVGPNPPATEAQFTLEIDNPAFPTLPAAPGTNLRIRQQQAAGDPANLRVRIEVPATAALLSQSSCDTRSANTYIYIKRAIAPATIYRLPGETGNRVAINSDEALAETLWSSSFSNATDPVTSRGAVDVATYPLYLTDPGITNPYYVPSRVPAGAILDGHAVVVGLRLFCEQHGTTVELPAPVLPIVVAQGFPQANLYVTDAPRPITVAEGQAFKINFGLTVTREFRLDFDSLETTWEESDPSGANFAPVRRGLPAPPHLSNTSGYEIDWNSGNLLPGVYGFFGSFSDDGWVQPLAGRPNLFDDGRMFRGRICGNLMSGGFVIERACATTPAVRLTVTATRTIEPRIELQPASQTVRVGQTFRVSAGWQANPRPRVVFWQWRPSDAHPWQTVQADTAWERAEPPTGFYQETQTSEASESRGTFVLDHQLPVTLAERGMQFRVNFTTDQGAVTSETATIDVIEQALPPTISTQPADQTAPIGSAMVLAGAATGTAPLSYQWFRDGVALGGANTPTLTIDPVNAVSTGNYHLEVSNGFGSVRTRAARVSVTTAAVPTVQPPALTMPPAALSVPAGSSAVFAVTASGGAPLSYEWSRNGAPIAGANTPVLMLSQVQVDQAGTFRVRVSNSAGSVTSADATLTVLAQGSPQPLAPSLQTQPAGLAVVAGQVATFAVAASGSGPLTFQWMRNGSMVVGAEGPVLTLPAVQSGDAGNYTVTVTNAAGTVTSNSASLVVTPVPGAPAITGQPASASVPVGSPASFTLAVSGNPAPACQWTRNGVAIDGANSCTGYATPATTPADQGSVYNVVVYGPGGVVIGRGAVLSVTSLQAPTIVTQPADATSSAGGSAMFRATASGTPAPLVQWVLNDHVLPMSVIPAFTAGPCTFDLDAADASLQLRAITAGCDGAQVAYRATSAVGTATSRTATLTVTPAVPPGSLTATQVVAGHEWSMVLRPDRTVWSWGGLHKLDGTVMVNNLAPADQARRPVQMYPAVLADVRQIAGWYDGFWALKGDPGSAASRVLHWGNAYAGNDGRGSDGAGNLGVIPTLRANATPVEVLERRSVNGVLQAAPVDRVCSIAATSSRLLMIRALDGFGAPTDCNPGSAKTVWVAGTLTQYSSDAVGVAVPVQGLPGTPARLVTQQHSAQPFSGPVLVILEDGRAFGWGTNIGNQFGLDASAGTGYVGSMSAPVALPAGWGTLRDAAFTFVGLIALRDDGTVMSSGRNDNGELGLGPQPSGTVNNGPLPLLAGAGTPLDGVGLLASTEVQVSLALRQGRILVWGAANQPLQGGSAARADYPQLLPASGDGWRTLAAGHAHALAIAANGAVYSWGNGLRGALGNGVDGGSALAPTAVMLP